MNRAVESDRIQAQQRVAFAEGSVWRRRVGVTEDSGHIVVTGLEAGLLQRGGDVGPVCQRIDRHGEVVVACGGGGDLFWRQVDDVSHSGLFVSWERRRE